MKQFFWGPARQAIDFSIDESVLEALLRAKIPVDHSCGGGASCGTCRVWIQHGPELAEPRLAPNDLEREFREERGFHKDERLSCQMTAEEGIWLQAPQPSSTNKEGV